jgi:DNA-binding LytR/AlgR family response regulator
MDNFFSRLVLSDTWRNRFARHVLFWLACWVFMGFIYGFLYSNERQQPDFIRSYLESLIYLPQHMLLSYGIIYFVLPNYIFKNRYWAGVAGIFIMILLAAMSSPIIQALAINPLHIWLNAPTKHSGVFQSFMGGLRGSMTIAGFAVAIKLVKQWYFKREENATLEKEKLHAELQLLRNQLHPHFIFNTLNSIYSLALKKSDQTPGSILKLAELMRYMFQDCSGNSIGLKREIEMLQNYILLSKARYRDRLEITIHIEGDLENKAVAPLIFLPFVENSFKYGANEMLEHAWITLELLVEEDALKFKLINGKPSGMDALSISSGLGLKNVKKRLEMLYPDAHELRITEDDDTFIVVLILDLKKNILTKKMKKISCLLVDDEPPSLEILRNYIANTPGLVIAGECHHAIAAFDFLQHQQVDLLFLDVNMPKLSGTNFLKALRNPPPVIFTTAHRDFAVDGYELGAIDYLLKPFSLDRFWKAIQRVNLLEEKEPISETHKASSERFIYVRADRKMVKIPIQDILFIESLKDYVKINLGSRQIVTKQTIIAIEEMLPEKEFVRIHRGFIASCSKVDSYSPTSIFIGKNELPIGPLYRQNFLSKISS